MGISNWECRLPGCPLRLLRTWDPTAYPGVAPGGAGCRSVGHTPESPHLQVHRAPGNDPHFSTLTTTAPGSPQSWGGLPRFDLSVFLYFLSQLFFLSGSGLEFCTRTVWLAVPGSRRGEMCLLTLGRSWPSLRMDRKVPLQLGDAVTDPGGKATAWSTGRRSPEHQGARILPSS